MADLRLQRWTRSWSRNGRGTEWSGINAMNDEWRILHGLWRANAEVIDAAAQ